MAAGAVDTTDVLVAEVVERKRAARGADPLYLVLEGLSSLKLSVVLFALGIFVILVGTLAQTEMDIWQVVPIYFRSWVMPVDVNLFFPESFFPGMPEIKFPPIPFPGGMFVGVLMLINLLSAHLWRFQIQAGGSKLLLGLGVLLVGIVFTTAIIVSGNLGTGIQAKPLLSPGQIWWLFCTLAGAAWFASAFLVARYARYELAALARESSAWAFRYGLLALLGLIFGLWSLLAWGLISGYLAPPSESMRILWQLLQGTAAGIVLLIGCWLLFGKRGGVVLLHAGVVLMMVSELVVARYAIEWQMTLEEGEASNFVRDIRTTELAIIDPSDPDAENVIVVPRRLLEDNAADNERLAKEKKPPAPIRDKAGTHELLPFDITVLRYLRNHDVRGVKPDEKTVATTGVGLSVVAEPARASRGTDMGGGVDVGAAYIKLTDKESSRDLGTYLVSQLAEPGVGMAPEKFLETVEEGGKKYELMLRFEREYKPYTVKLEDVRKDDYLGSDTPKNYSSDVELIDPETVLHSKVHIKMNDPLRYRGDTFYQSSYTPAAPALGRGETTTLQVVNNVGWMIPYIACMIVVTGMVFQFSVALQRFLNRREQEESLQNAKLPTGRKGYGAELTAAGIALAIAVLYVGPKLREPASESLIFDTVEFGKLPIVHSGRVKPIDTLARNSLRALSNYETTKVVRNGKRVRLSAVEWLLDVVSHKPESFDYQVIKVDHPELLKLMALEPQPKNLYSVNQLKDKLMDLQTIASKAHEKRKKDSDSLTDLDRKALELGERLRLYDVLSISFNPPRIPPEISQAADADMKGQLMAAWMQSYPLEIKELGAPLIVPSAPIEGSTGQWEAYPLAFISALRAQATGGEVNPAMEHMASLLAAYAENKPAEFRKSLAQYQAHLKKIKPHDYAEKKVRTEAYFNHVSPFYLGAILYVFALLLALLGWLFQARPLQVGALTLIAATFLFHTAALIVRIYISGRPPVTNLYSSAIFIGWGCILVCLVLELIYRNGLGNVVGAMTGFAALLISYFLAAGGDTIAVLQAVLDTQFWLATHVVLITLGYTATYIAGFFGLCYVIFGICTPQLTEKLRSELARMIYGVVCFAIVLSFFGTVLGGLWADDSWGRFWGWDPKENGALIIVLWNALVLHARWDKLVKDRGLALLAIGGNIVTSWSWFGVNELGIGLHSYGFTEGVLRALGTFALYMLVCVGFGLVPLRLWWSADKSLVSREFSTWLAVSFGIVNTLFLSAFGYFAYQYLA